MKKYSELIRLLSLVGEKAIIEDKCTNCLVIHLFSNDKELLIFRLEVDSENKKSINISWKIPNSIDYIESHCFPSFLSQKEIFDILISKITEWQYQVTISKMSDCLKNAQDAEENIKKIFIEDYTLLDFARNHGNMSVGKFTNNQGKTYHKCLFTKEDGISTSVSFFSQLGELTPQEIKDRKYELFVGQMKSGKYYLHAKDINLWEDVNIDNIEG